MRVGATLEQLAKDYGPNLRIVYKNFVVHPQIATDPALAMCAAHEQGKAFEFEKLIWDTAWPDGKPADLKASLAAASMEKLAEKLRLNTAKFKADMASEKCKASIDNDRRTLAQVGTSGTPAFYVNGRFLSGNRPIDQFKALIDEELKKADAAIAGGVKADQYYANLVKTGKTKLDPPPAQAMPGGAPGQPVVLQPQQGALRPVKP